MNQQRPLFPMDAPNTDEEALDPLTLLRNGAALVLSVSGGKDSVNSDAECTEFAIIER